MTANDALAAWRVGRRVGRTIYAQLGERPSEDDPLIGVMDHPELAALAVRCRNEHLVTAAALSRVSRETE